MHMIGPLDIPREPLRSIEPRVALFDVDGTLLKGSSSYEAAWFLFRRGMVKPHHVGLALWYALAHGLGVVTYETMYRIGLKLFAGMSEAEALRLSRACLRERVVSRFYIDALQELQAQRTHGRKIVLVSAGPRYLVRAIGEWLEVDADITAGPTLENDLLTDVLDGPVCSGEGKVQRVRGFLWEHGLSLGDCVYYGDSINDRPLLELVGQRIVVNPDPRLRRIAAARGWRIVGYQATKAAHARASRGTPVSP